MPDKTKRFSKQRAADLVDKQHNDEIRRSIKKSNLTRQQEFKKMKKHQKKSGRIVVIFFLSISTLISLEKSMDNLGNALDSIVRLTPTSTADNDVGD